MSTSERIADFLDFLRGCPEAYRMRRADQQEEENRTQDLLHKLELEPLGYHDTARAAQVLADARGNRKEVVFLLRAAPAHHVYAMRDHNKRV